ncbi:PIN/TRAM domain-containing protein [Vagococcus fluvialis]|uniref:PIN/TRAM domain-containing protein n=1 Tax=Vagococcus fluvialis TaxID=2738 RepID=UPI0028908F91|nr:PIN/TRAM domain-containing protein [Vagococcus fluvialis]MDT2782253.1 PIN/TRAM domain-containing protein [Vagococcus fluvialis]
MQKKIFNIVMALIGFSLGATLIPVVWTVFKLDQNQWLNNDITNGIIGAIIFVIISIFTFRYVGSAIKKVEKFIGEQSLQDIVFGSIGVIVGLLLGALVSIPLYSLKIALLNILLPALIMLILGYFGFKVGTTKTEEWKKLFAPRPKKGTEEIIDKKPTSNFHQYKILDTSVIIDGRIYDVAKTGFIEGTLLIPNFVLYELQYIADSGDSLKRVRGRRGLDILNALQKEPNISVEMYEGDFEDIQEVDSKLIKLAKMLDGIVVTNDYNLNKVSEFQNVPVFNINALANAIKPVVIPGETMDVLVMKDGTERQQGVAYLDDGTMVVVEDGKHFMNKRINVIVTSALQTAAGRMIFAKPSHSQTTINN